MAIPNRITVDLERAGKLESEIEKKLQSGQSIGSVMDESLAVVKNEIFWGDDRMEDAIKWSKANE